MNYVKVDGALPTWISTNSVQKITIQATHEGKFALYFHVGEDNEYRVPEDFDTENAAMMRARQYFSLHS